MCSLAGRRTETLVLSARFFSNSAPWMGFRLSGLVKFSVVRHPGCHKGGHGNSHLNLRCCLWPNPETPELPAAHVGPAWLPCGWKHLGLCCWGQAWAHPLWAAATPLWLAFVSCVEVTWACGGHTQRGLCPPGLGCPFCPAPLSVPRFLNLSLSFSSLIPPRLPSCNGPAVWGCLSSLTSQFAFLVCVHQGPWCGRPH